MDGAVGKFCKYCTSKLEDCFDEGLTCVTCNANVHVRCLKSGSVPSDMYGDIFYTFTCLDCSDTGKEIFIRDKMQWYRILALVIYHIQKRNPGLGRKGFFHFRNHVVAYINSHWDALFPQDCKKKKKWEGTVAGNLSQFRPFIFRSGTALMNGEQGWWSLTYPKLSPNVISNMYQIFVSERQRLKLLKVSYVDAEVFNDVLNKHVKNKELLEDFNNAPLQIPELDKSNEASPLKKVNNKHQMSGINKRKNILPTFESTSKRLMKAKENSIPLPSLGDDFTVKSHLQQKAEMDEELSQMEEEKPKKTIGFLDPLCHYEICMKSLSQDPELSLREKLTGAIREESIPSPYSGIYLKCLIYRDVEQCPDWLQLMTDIECKANEKDKSFVLPPRYPIDYSYVQPQHIPAINSMCNRFFWPGIDLTDALKYPEYSCVTLYKSLIVAFAFMVPNVSHTENYISFIFTRPMWRNAKIGKFMLYHLIMMSPGKDITLHVAVDNPALLLYQQFGFKIESKVKGFYSKYLRDDSRESKDAFYCRFERMPHF